MNGAKNTLRVLTNTLVKRTNSINMSTVSPPRSRSSSMSPVSPPRSRSSSSVGASSNSNLNFNSTSSSSTSTSISTTTPPSTSTSGSISISPTSTTLAVNGIDTSSSGVNVKSTLKIPTDIAFQTTNILSGISNTNAVTHPVGSITTTKNINGNSVSSNVTVTAIGSLENPPIEQRGYSTAAITIDNNFFGQELQQKLGDEEQVQKENEEEGQQQEQKQEERQTFPYIVGFGSGGIDYLQLPSNQSNPSNPSFQQDFNFYTENCVEDEEAVILTNNNNAITATPTTDASLLGLVDFLPHRVDAMDIDEEQQKPVVVLSVDKVPSIIDTSVGNTAKQNLDSPSSSRYMQPNKNHANDGLLLGAIDFIGLPKEI